MSFMRVYVTGYFILIAGALFALWNGEILSRIPLAWLAIGLMIAVAPGIVLLVTAAPPSVPP
jgi:hypothetical protein